MDLGVVIGFFILAFAPTLGRLHWIAGLITYAAGFLTMIIAGCELAVALAIGGVVMVASSFVHNKITGDIVITDIFGYIIGIVLIILGIVVV